jgi:acetoin utilization deacetylase AcuC-like enzyme
MVSVFYNPEYVGAAHAFETTRKAKWVADSMGSAPISGVELVSPPSLSYEQLVQVHAPEYVRAVQTGVPRGLAQSQGFDWDAGLWSMVLASNGGAVAATLAALQTGVAGSLSSGLHHAKRDRGAGFCTFNGLVIAAREALAAGAGSVLILDLDAHCGGGTASLIAEEPRIWQVDVSVDHFDCYATRERATLRVVRDSDEYLDEIERALQEVRRQGPRFGLCLYNAGMDPFERCTTGGLTGITREILVARERLVFEWCREQELPIAFVLAGGYLGSRLDEGSLVDLHRLTLSAAVASEGYEAPGSGSISRRLTAFPRRGVLDLRDDDVRHTRGAAPPLSPALAERESMEGPPSAPGEAWAEPRRFGRAARPGRTPSGPPAPAQTVGGMLENRPSRSEHRSITFSLIQPSALVPTPRQIRDHTAIGSVYENPELLKS